MRPTFPTLACGLSLLLGSSSALANPCALTIQSTDQMTFVPTELSVPAHCKEVTLTLQHAGTLPATTMGHNWVLAETSKLRPLAIAGMNAADNAYVPKDDERVIAHTRVIGGGESDTITFSTEGLTPGGDYSYFCSFPGHWSVMKGKFIFL